MQILNTGTRVQQNKLKRGIEEEKENSKPQNKKERTKERRMLTGVIVPLN